jgi:hypothetical protein
MVNSHNHTDEATRIIGKKYKPDLLDFIKPEAYTNPKQHRAYQLYLAQQELKDDARAANL